MQRGELYLVRRPPGDPKPQRVFVTVSGRAVIDSRFPTVICAPVRTRGGGLPTQVRVGVAEGLKHESWILCDQLTSLPKTSLSRYVGALRGDQLSELNQALRSALDL